MTDTVLNQETRVEPRIMKLLLLLAGSQGIAVTREQIINDIWDNYGGADEGLSQAVSFLRKLLLDTEKQLIVTIPKKGYVLEAPVSYASKPDASAEEPPTAVTTVKAPPIPTSRNEKNRLRIAVAVALPLLAALLWWLLAAPHTTSQQEPTGTMIDSGHPSQEQRELQYDHHERPIDSAHQPLR